MSDPIRYTGKTEGSLLGSPHWEHPEGEWVKWEDYDCLQAEVEQLKEGNECLNDFHDKEMARSAYLCEQVERLEHQVNYWRIEAETDNARWLRCLEDNERLRKLVTN